MTTTWQQALANAAGLNAAAKTQITTALDNAGVLAEDLDNDLGAYVSSFAGQNLVGAGAEFVGGTIYISANANGDLNDTNIADLVFQLGHEQSHSLVDGPTGSVTIADQQFAAGVQGGSQSLDSLIQADQTAHAIDESNAQIAGWNAYVNYEQTLNPSVTLQTLANSSGYARFFLNPDGTTITNGPTVNSNFSVNPNSQNISAESQLFYYGSSYNLGTFGNQNYANYYGSSELGTIIRNGSGSSSMNFSADNLNPSLIAEGLGYYAGANKTFALTDSGTHTTYTYTTDSTGAVATVTSSAASASPTVFVGNPSGLNTTGSIVSQSNATVTVATKYSTTLTGGSDNVTLLGSASATNPSGQTNAFTSQLIGTNPNVPENPLPNQTSNLTVTGQATITAGVSAEGDAQATLNGANVTGTVGADSSVVVTQSGDNLTMMNGSNVDTTGGQTVTLTCGATSSGTPNTLEFSGSGSTSTSCAIDSSTGEGTFTTDASHGTLASSGADASFIDTGSDSTVELASSNTSATILGTGVTIQGSQSGDQLTLGGSGNVADISNGAITLSAANLITTVGGSGNIVSGGSFGGQSLTLDGSGNILDLNTSSVSAAANVGLTYTGDGSTLALSSGDAASVGAGSSGNTYDLSGAGIQLNGAFNSTVNASAGTSGLLSGSGLTVNEDVSDAGAINYGGTSGTDTVNWTNVTDGGPLSWQISFDPSAGVADQTSDWSGAGATGSKLDQIDDWSGGGSQLTEYDPQSGVSLILADYTGDQATGEETDETDDFTGGYSQYTQFNPNASETSVTYGYSGEDRTGTKDDELIDWSAGGSQLQAFDPGYGLQSVTFNFTGGNATGETSTEDLVGDGGYSEDVTFDYDGSGDVTGFQEAYYDGSSYLGTDDFNGYGQLIGYSGALGGGDFGNGGGDGGNPGDYGYGSGGNYGGFGYGYGGYDLASATAGKGRGISEIAAYDLNHGKLGAAASAEAAFFQAKLTAQSSPDGGVLAPETQAAKWAGKTITWSFATGSGTTAAPVSGSIGAQYQGLVAQAFAAWAKSTGLKFVQTADSGQADIRIGWGDFDTASSGVLGYTTSPASNGVLQAGAVIRLEDPTQNALVVDANGQLSYAGTDAELTQLIMHEIGHAIGLGDSSDPASIMYSVANDQDRAISGSDVAAVEALYDEDGTPRGASARSSVSASSGRSSASSAGFGIDASQLIEAMAGFNLSPSELPWEPVSHGAVLTGAALLVANSQLHAA